MGIIIEQIKSFKEINDMQKDVKIAYFNHLREHISSLKIRRQTNSLFESAIANIAPLLRNYELEIRGEENIPDSENALFICNHSNTHDFFTIKETFYKIHRHVTPLAAWDGLSTVSRIIFRLGDITFLKRDDKNSKQSGIQTFANKILSGKDGIIFGEATWNLHPIRPMQPIKAGGTLVSLITRRKIIPTIFEYVEVPYCCKKEKELYKKCVVWFGKPITVNSSNNIFDETSKIQAVMEEMRMKLWDEFGIKRHSLSDIDRAVYLNHTFIKKYKAIGFKYDSEYESKFLLKKIDSFENEYCLDELGNFVPEINPNFSV